MAGRGSEREVRPLYPWRDRAVQSDLERIDTRASARTVLVIVTITAKINNFLEECR
jgi:hypothetical protein